MNSHRLAIALLTLSTASKISKPWGNYDGNGGLRDGHYCAANSLSPPTSFNFSSGYWAGITWASTNPAPGVYNFSEVDAILRAADTLDQFVEFNALIGQCSPTWLYSNGVTALNVNWKPPPTCVPPTCVPAGTWSCENHGCGCDGVYPCNQTFPDYLSPIYLKHAQEWINATHAHLTSLPDNLKKRILSVQVNAGSTGDGCFFHGRLYPDQQKLTPQSNPPCYTCSKLGDKTWRDYYHKYYMQIAETYVSAYATIHPTPAPSPPPTPPPSPPPSPSPTKCRKTDTCHDCFFETFHCQDGKHPLNASTCLSCVNKHRAALSAPGPDGKALCNLNSSHIRGWCHRVWRETHAAAAVEQTTAQGEANNTEHMLLLFNGFSNNADLVALVNASSLRREGYMIKDGLVSHSYSVSGEMQVWNTSRRLLQTPLPGSSNGNRYVRSRGETTLSAFIDWELRPAWTAWALATWAACYGLDTWQNNTLIEKVPAMRPALSFFTKYAGTRDKEGKSSPGAWAVLRDGLDVADTSRFPEATFGSVDKGKNLARCTAIVDFVSKTQTRHPPRLDAPSNKSCGSGRRRLGLNDAGYQVYPGNYNGFLRQRDADASSYGAWRIGPREEIFGRYGRSVVPSSAGMAFEVLGGVFGDYEGDVHVRVVFFRPERTASSASADFVVAYSTTSTLSGGADRASKCVSKAISTAKDGEGHWVEARFTVALDTHERFGGGACHNGADVVIDEPGTGAERIVFNLIEISKRTFTVQLSPWLIRVSE